MESNDHNPAPQKYMAEIKQTVTKKSIVRLRSICVIKFTMPYNSAFNADSLMLAG